MPYASWVGSTHVDLKTFALFVRKTCPRLMHVLAGPEGKQSVWDGLMALVKEIDYPHEINVTDKIADTLRALIPYVEAYSEAVDCSEFEGKEQKIQF